MTFEQCVFECDINRRKQMLCFDAYLLEYEMKIAELENTDLLTESTQDECFSVMMEGVSETLGNMVQSIKKFLSNIFGSVKEAGGQKVISKSYDELVERHKSGQFNNDSSIKNYSPKAEKKLRTDVLGVFEKVKAALMNGDIPDALREEFSAACAFVDSLTMDERNIFIPTKFDNGNTEDSVLDMISDQINSLVSDSTQAANKAVDLISDLQDKYKDVINNSSKVKSDADKDKKDAHFAKIGADFARTAQGAGTVGTGRDLDDKVNAERSAAKKKAAGIQKKLDAANEQMKNLMVQRTELMNNKADSSKINAKNEEINKLSEERAELEKQYKAAYDRSQKYDKTMAQKEIDSTDAKRQVSDAEDKVKSLPSASKGTTEAYLADVKTLADMLNKVALIEGYYMLNMQKGLSKAAKEAAKKGYKDEIGASDNNMSDEAKEKRELLKSANPETIKKMREDIEAQKKKVEKRERDLEKSADGKITSADIAYKLKNNKVTKAVQDARDKTKDGSEKAKSGLKRLGEKLANPIKKVVRS